ncbi:hypothetical protein MK805_13835 [Shimazuella sp. AN120528]|uniref:hypothetical protein n=1 Tax=Shimazuella soli TaxID=1892854 RepID=UPI001F112DA8|nr:hypothetical protein [Shimazuella soli]MCH5586020.1 hypothetical protein [Shimazuella soli]
MRNKLQQFEVSESYYQKRLMTNAELCYQSALKLEDKIKKKYLSIKTHTHLESVYCEFGQMKKRSVYT